MHINKFRSRMQRFMFLLLQLYLFHMPFMKFTQQRYGVYYAQCTMKYEQQSSWMLDAIKQARDTRYEGNGRSITTQVENHETLHNIGSDSIVSVHPRLDFDENKRRRQELFVP